MRLKALLITIDGLDRDLFNQSNMRFIKSFYYKPIKSVEPVITPACSVSILTGLDPFKHGILDFYDNNFRVINAKSIPYLYFTDILNLRGYRLGLWKVPLIYPKRYRGFVAWGIEAPKIACCENLEYYLKKINCRSEEIERYKSDENYLEIYKKRTLKEILVFKKLAYTFKIDVGFFWLRYSDIISHVFYGRRQDLLKDYYEFLDDLIRDLIETFEPDIWIIFGDHGFTENRYVISFTRFLLEEKIIKWRSKIQELLHLVTYELGPDRLVKYGFLKSSGALNFMRVNSFISRFYQFDDLFFIGSEENLLRFKSKKTRIREVILSKLSKLVRLMMINNTFLIIPRKHISLTRLVLKKPINRVKYKFRSGIHWLDTIVASNDKNVLKIKKITHIHDFILRKLKRKIHRIK